MPSRRPLIGVSCCRRTDSAEPVHGVVERYVNAVANFCDGEVVLVPALGMETHLEDLLDGLVLTGSPSNLAPQISGNTSGEGPFDPARDETNLQLAGKMLQADKPVFGICRGLQELNVLFKGTIKSVDASYHHSKTNHPVSEMFAHKHPVSIAPGGVLDALLPSANRIVNSVHYQGIDRLGPGLIAEAHAPDGLIEAFSDGPGGNILAVQWHPEWDATTNSDSEALFRHFSDMVKAKRKS